MNINIIFNSQVSSLSMGGGDKIGIMLASRWRSKGANILFIGCDEGMEMVRRSNFGFKLRKVSFLKASKIGVVGAYFFRMLHAILSPFPLEKKSVIYSSSDFLPDVIPAFRAKILEPNHIWIAGFYLRAKNPFTFETKLNIKTILYFLGQQISIFLMKKAADLIFVLCNDDFKYLVKKGISSRKIARIRGGIDLKEIENINSGEDKIYDGCFVGRFHEQKGLPELIKVWHMVVENLPDAKLVIVGWGAKKWELFIKREIERLGMKKNVILKGFVDGKEKFEIMKSSKLFLFPSNYESWGLVVLEALGCGLPVVSFDLSPLKQNFAKGILYIPLHDLSAFAQQVIKLLEDKDAREKLSIGAHSEAKKFAWQSIGNETFDKINSLYMRICYEDK